MADIEYGNVSNELQSQVQAVLSADSTVSGFTTNILDGTPRDLWKGRGFPYVLVHSPTISEDRLTMTKFDMTASMRIEVVSERESVVRQVYDAVRDALKSNKTIRSSHAYWYRNVRSTINYTRVDIGGRMQGYWTIIALVEYRVVSA